MDKLVEVLANGPVQVVLILLGALFLLLAILGTISVGGSAVGSDQPVKRSLLGGLGVLFLFAVCVPAIFGRAELPQSTAISIGGVWTMSIQGSRGGPVTFDVMIEQQSGRPYFVISGERREGGEGTANDGDTPSFESIFGLIRGRQILFAYENGTGEKGMAFGQVSRNRPGRFRLNYYDLYQHDKNSDPAGRLMFTRVE